MNKTNYLKIFLTNFLLTCNCFNLCRGQIVGDDVKLADDKNKFPSQVLVEVKLSWHPVNYPKIKTPEFLQKFIAAGSGTIISESWILTSAHLLNKEIKEEKFLFKRKVASNVEEVRVMVGQHNRKVKGSRVEVDRVIIHHDYNEDLPGSDIALMHLKTPLNFNSENCNKMELAPKKEKLHMDCVISGWGISNEGQLSDVLMWAKTRIVSPFPSKDNWTDGISYFKDLFTVGTPHKKFRGKENYARASIRHGDSGGGLVCVHEKGKYLYGVAHSGRAKHAKVEEYGTEGMPCIFASVWYHKEWIEGTMRCTQKGGKQLVYKSRNEQKKTGGLKCGNFEGGKKLKKSVKTKGYSNVSGMIAAVFVGAVFALVGFLCNS